MLYGNTYLKFLLHLRTPEVKVRHVVCIMVIVKLVPRGAARTPGTTVIRRFLQRNTNVYVVVGAQIIGYIFKNLFEFYRISVVFATCFV